MRSARLTARCKGCAKLAEPKTRALTGYSADSHTPPTRALTLCRLAPSHSLPTGTLTLSADWHPSLTLRRLAPSHPAGLHDQRHRLYAGRGPELGHRVAHVGADGLGDRNRAIADPVSPSASRQRI